eukprot:jgi/Phyca11/555816/estExt2_Genewise1Plus.C_PHYCAscaffold_780099
MQNPTHLESDDYFEVLGLRRSASAADVKKAYRKLAVQWHPDKNRSNPRAEEFFKKISEAYEVLSDREKRKVYEDFGKPGLDTNTPPDHRDNEHFGFHGFGTRFSSQRARDIFDAFFGGQDPFEAFFGGDQRRRTSFQGRRDPFEAMGFGAMGMGMDMRGFGHMDMTTADSFFSDFGAMGDSRGVFSTSTSSSSSSFTDRNGHTVMKKTTTTTGTDGRTETVTEEYRDGNLVKSTSSTGSRLAGAGRMHLERNSNQNEMKSYQRRGSCPKY